MSKWETKKGSGGVFISMSDGSPVFVAEALGATMAIKEARSQRIVDCVNACDGIVDPTELRRQRDDLLALLKVAECPACDGSGGIPHQVGEGDWEQEQCQWCDERKQAISHAEGGE